jgi:hypothetical protein
MHKIKIKGKLPRAQNGLENTTGSDYDPEFLKAIDWMADYEQEGSSAGTQGYVGGGKNWGTNLNEYNTGKKDAKGKPIMQKIGSKEDAIKYYYEKYWPRVKDLPPALRTRALQMAVNMGDPYGELMTAGSSFKGVEPFSPEDRIATRSQRKDLSPDQFTGDDWKNRQAQVLAAYNANPTEFMKNLDAEQNRYYNQGLQGVNDKEKNFLTGYYKGVGNIANEYLQPYFTKFTGVGSTNTTQAAPASTVPTMSGPTGSATTESTSVDTPPNVPESTTTTTVPPSMTGKGSGAGPFGLSANQMTGIANYAKELNANAPKEDAKAARLSDQPFYNPFDVKWGQRQDPQIDVTGEYSNKPFDQYATSVNTSTTPSRGSLNLPQLVNPNLLSKDKKQEKKKEDFNWNQFGNNLGRLGNSANLALNTVGAVTDYFVDRKKQKDWDKWFRKQNLPDNMYAVSPGNDRGDYDINEGIYRPNQLTPPNIGAAVAQFGGSMIKDTTMGKVKIRLKENGKLSRMAYGGQSQGMSLGLDLGQKDVYRHMPKEKSEEVRSVIPQVPRSQANIEAEKGETVYGDLDGDGALEHMKIGGKRHTQGGTPLDVPEGSFIYSDTPKMVIKDLKVLSEFGMSPRKSGYTPAEIAKKYDINKYKAIMEDPYVDGVRKSTAQIMIKNFQTKLAKLALVQEEMKGFPQGVPQIVKDTFPEIAQQVEESLAQRQGQQANEDEQVMEQGLSDVDQEQMGEEQYAEEAPEGEGEYEEEATPPYAFGGIFGDLAEFQDGGTNRYPVWDPEYQKVISDYINNKYEVQMPINAADPNDPDRFTLPSRQSARGGKRVYGEEDWRDAAHTADFEKRQAEFIKENPNWDPTKEGETLRFQQWYNKKAKELGLPEYFTSKNTFSGLDDKFGEYTFSAPSLTPPPVQAKTVPGYICKDGKVQVFSYPDEAARNAAGAKASQQEAEINCKPQPYTRPGEISQVVSSKQIPGGWFPPDLVNMAAASAIFPRKYLPYIAQAPYEPNRVSLEDWRAQAAARQSQFNKAAEVMGVYGSTTGQGANLSSAAGQQAEGLAGDIAQVNSRNVDRLNQFLQNERQRKDQFNLLGANRATELYKGNVIANQQYDNARRQYLNNIAKTYGQGFANSMYASMINAVNPYFKLNPRIGQALFTGNGLGFDNLGGSSGVGDSEDMMAKASAIKTELMAKYPNLSEKTIEQIALKQAGLSSSGGGYSQNAAAALAIPALYRGALSFDPVASTSENSEGE